MVLPSTEKIRSFWYSFFKTDDDKLDPISVLALIALMRFKEQDSKIHITNDCQVVAQQPSDYHYGPLHMRGVVRRFQHASHEDLAIVRPCIEKGARWYQPQVEGNAEIRELFQFAAKGLEALKVTYKDKSGITSDALENWQKLMREACERGLGPEVPLDSLTRRVKDLWNKTEISKVNLYLMQMYAKQKNVPIEMEIRCQDEISQLEFLLQQKSEVVRKIFMK